MQWLFVNCSSYTYRTPTIEKEQEEGEQKKRNGNEMKYRRKIYCDWLCVHCVYSVRSSSHKVFKLRLSGFLLAFFVSHLLVHAFLCFYRSLIPYSLSSSPHSSPCARLPLFALLRQPYRGNVQYIFILSSCASVYRMGIAF